MDTNSKSINIKSESLRCDSSKCMKLKDGNWEERFEDLIFSVGP